MERTGGDGGKHRSVDWIWTGVCTYTPTLLGSLLVIIVVECMYIHIFFTFTFLPNGFTSVTNNTIAYNTMGMGELVCCAYFLEWVSFLAR